MILPGNMETVLKEMAGSFPVVTIIGPIRQNERCDFLSRGYTLPPLIPGYTRQALEGCYPGPENTDEAHNVAPCALSPALSAFKDRVL